MGNAALEMELNKDVMKERNFICCKHDCSKSELCSSLIEVVKMPFDKQKICLTMSLLSFSD